MRDFFKGQVPVSKFSLTSFHSCLFVLPRQCDQWCIHCSALKSVVLGGGWKGGSPLYTGLPIKKLV